MPNLIECPACKASPFRAAEISLCIGDAIGDSGFAPEGLIERIDERKVILDFSKVSMKDCAIYSIRCSVCGEFIYHYKNLLWGDWSAEKDAHKWKDRRYENVNIEKGRANRDDFSALLELFKKDPDTIKKLAGDL